MKLRGAQMKNLETKIYVWKPSEGLEGKFYIYSINFDSELKIILFKDIDPKKGVLLDFSGTARTYRITDVDLVMHLLEGPICREKEQPSVWAFFTVENSEYLKWASYQSDTVSEALGLIHYVIRTENWIIDVLSWSKQPHVELIDINDYIKKINAISI
jgi:hypothetical protein